MRVLVIDDHSIIRMALKHILRELTPDAEVVQAANGRDALSRLDESAAPFDMIITDLYMPDGGIDLVKALVNRAGQAPVIVFTVSEQASDVRGALAAGARAYMPKTTDDPLIISILRLVIAGGTYVPPLLTRLTSDQDNAAVAHPAPATLSPAPSQAGAVALAERSVTSPRPLPPLTKRQYQVLELLAEGLSNAAIGERLDLNLSTVKSHVTGVLRALGVTSRTQAVLTFKQSEWGHAP